MPRHISASEQHDSSGGVLTEVKCRRCGKPWAIRHGFKPFDSQDKLTSWCFERSCGTTIMRDYSSSDRIPMFWGHILDK